MKVAPIKPKILDYIKKHNLIKKFKKQLNLLQTNPRHPSLHTELLEPKEIGIRSFRIDLNYRALFIYDQENSLIRIQAVGLHYQ